MCNKRIGVPILLLSSAMLFGIFVAQTVHADELDDELLEALVIAAEDGGDIPLQDDGGCQQTAGETAAGVAEGIAMLFTLGGSLIRPGIGEAKKYYCGGPEYPDLPWEFR